jgi:hypothetical protein
VRIDTISRLSKSLIRRGIVLKTNSEHPPFPPDIGLRIKRSGVRVTPGALSFISSNTLKTNKIEMTPLRSPSPSWTSKSVQCHRSVIVSRETPFSSFISSLTSRGLLDGSIDVRGGDRSIGTGREERNVNLTREEQETIIRTSAASKTWEVVTADPRIIRKNGETGIPQRRTPESGGLRLFYDSVRSSPDLESRETEDVRIGTRGTRQESIPVKISPI